MPVKVRLSEINVAKLNTDTVIMITKFINRARSNEDFDLHMQQPGLIKDIIRYGEKSKDPELIILCMKIKKAISIYIKESDPEHTSFNVYH